MRDKRGQFFIIAAIIIIVIIASVTTISNYTSTKDEVRLADLGEEIGIESQQVIESGTFNELDDSEMKTLLAGFANNYVTYIQEEKNIYFVFGDSDGAYFLGYQELDDEQVCLRIFEVPEGIEGGVESESDGGCEWVMGGELNLIDHNPTKELSRINVLIGEDPDPSQYEFELTEGENFYFVIWRQIRGERHVVTNRE